MANLTLDLTSYLDRIGFDLWYDDSNVDLEAVADRVSNLRTQLEVQGVFQKTVLRLRKHSDATGANRVKHFMKFLFEKTDRAKDKQARLRELDCDVIIFCAHCYKVKEIYHMAPVQFDFLLANVTEYVRCRDLSDVLFRDDIARVIYGRFEPENNEVFKTYLKQYIELRPTRGTKRGFDEPRSDAEKRSRTSIQHDTSNSPSDERREMKYMYTNAPVEIIKRLPEPFKKAVENSRLWKWERSQAMNRTSCLATLFPKDDTQDVSFTIWCGHKDGYDLSKIYGVQRAISS